MSMNISGTNSEINANSKQYKAAAKEHLSDIITEEAMMTPEQKMLYEMLGGREAHMKNVMQSYNSDGDYVGPDKLIVPGMYVGEDGSRDPSTWQEMIPVSEDARQEMFDLVKSKFIDGKGYVNFDDGSNSDVYRNYQLSINKEDRLKGTWSLQQYAQQYQKALYDAVKAANPNWKQGQGFDTSILNDMTRESVDKTLVKAGNSLLRKTIDYSI